MKPTKQNTFNKLFLVILLFFLTFNNSFAQIGFTQKGVASYYADKFHGRQTASGEKYNKYDMTAAHPKLAFNSMVKVTNTANNKFVIVRINDRGPFTKSRIIDLSKKAAIALDMIQSGTAKVAIEVVGINGEVPQEIPEQPDNKEKPLSDTNELFKTGNTYSMWGTQKFPKGWGIQLASFNQLDNAKKISKELIGKKHEEVYIQVGWNKHEKVYRVIYGSFSKKKEARKKAKKLKQEGYKGFPKRHFK